MSETTIIRISEFRFELQIYRRSAFFEGHFPAHPILPAVAHLFLLHHIMKLLLGQTVEIREIPRMHLLHPVRPGDRLTVDITPESSSALRFTVMKDRTTVVHGVACWARSASP